jgi:hypothetical protein
MGRDHAELPKNPVNAAMIYGSYSAVMFVLSCPELYIFPRAGEAANGEIDCYDGSFWKTRRGRRVSARFYRIS